MFGSVISAIILFGVTINKGCIIGAMSLVNNELNNCLYTGVPAKIKKFIK